MSTGEGDAIAGGQPSEEELRAAYEAEIKKIRVEHILLEQVVTLVNLGMRRTGLAPGTEGERDPDQVRLAIDAVRALLPLVEQVAAPQVGPIRDALSQLQLAYVRIGGAPPAEGQQAGTAAGSAPGAPAASPAGDPSPASSPGSEQPAARPGEAGPAQRSGRLWVPGQ